MMTKDDTSCDERHARPFPRGESNVGSIERTISLCGGAVLLWGAIRGQGIGRWIRMGLGGTLLFHGIKRNCRLYESLGVRSADATMASHPLSRSIQSCGSITIDAEPQQLYDAWRDPEQLRRIFPHATEIARLPDPALYRWTVELPGGRTMSWDSTVNEQPDKNRLSWQTARNQPLQHDGSIEFVPAIGGRGTRVLLEMYSHLPGGAIGALLLKLMNRSPSWEAAEALRRLKQWIETGEIASSRSPAHRGNGWNGHSLRDGSPTRPHRSRGEPFRRTLDTSEDNPSESIPRQAVGAGRQSEVGAG